MVCRSVQEERPRASTSGGQSERSGSGSEASGVSVVVAEAGEDDASAVPNAEGRTKDEVADRDDLDLEELPPPPLPVEDFIIDSQAEEDVQVRQGLPSLSKTTPFGNVFGGWSVVLVVLVEVVTLVSSFPSDNFVNACGKRFDGIACVAGKVGQASRSIRTPRSSRDGNFLVCAMTRLHNARLESPVCRSEILAHAAAAHNFDDNDRQRFSEGLQPQRYHTTRILLRAGEKGHIDCNDCI